MNTVDTIRDAVTRFSDWRKRERARHQALRNMEWMSARDFADIGVSRASLEFELNRPSRYY